MTYTKPTIVALLPASIAIQGHGTKGMFEADSHPKNGPLSTSGSYDLDE